MTAVTPTQDSAAPSASSIDGGRRVTNSTGTGTNSANVPSARANGSMNPSTGSPSAQPLTPAPSAQGQTEPPARDNAQDRGTWTVSFATLLTEDRARTMADSIVVDGKKARVVPGNRDGVPVWRVLLGPFDSRQAAERAGMASQLSYWVFEGMP